MSNTRTILPSEPNRRMSIPTAGLTMAMTVLSTKGSGKSRLGGRILAYQYMLYNYPLIIIDPAGGLIDNLLDKIGRLTSSDQERQLQKHLFSRVRYVNMAGQQMENGDWYVVPFPIYQQTADSQFPYDIAKAFVDVIARSDPNLATASVQGLNRLAPLLLSGGIITAANQGSILDLFTLIHSPKDNLHLVDQALSRFSSTDVVGAGADLRDLAALQNRQPREFETRTEVFRNKLARFRLSPIWHQMFGSKPHPNAIVWQEVVHNRQAVLLDFRDIEDSSDKRFAMYWVLQSLTSWMRTRGKEAIPTALMIDELSDLVSGQDAHSDIFAADLNSLLNVYARNNSVAVTLMSQELHQFRDPRIQHTLMSCGNLILGSTSNKDTALYYARRFFRHDPYAVKEVLPVYGSNFGEYFELDTRNVYYSFDEQDDANANRFLDLREFQFFAGISEREGRPPTKLLPFTIAGIDVGCYPEDALLLPLKQVLMRKCGIKLQENLQEISPAAQADTPSEQSKATKRSPRIQDVVSHDR